MSSMIYALVSKENNKLKIQNIIKQHNHEISTKEEILLCSETGVPRQGFSLTEGVT